jgi:hypothetical protein
MTQRIGATSKATIAPAVLQQLNQGVLTTATLSEALAVDFADLMQNVFPAITPDAITRMQQAAGLGITKRMELAATMLSEQLSPKQLNALSQHPSDTVRGWAAYSIAIAPSPQLENTLDRVMEDPSRYVQDSCANWLNDAAKRRSAIFSGCGWPNRMNKVDQCCALLRLLWVDLPRLRFLNHP